MLKVKSINSFFCLTRLTLSLTAVLFISAFFFSGTLHAEPSCKNIKKERRLFLKTYKKKQYIKAYSRLSEFMKDYSNSENCRKKFIKDQVWAYSDLALAAYKIKDPEK